MAKSGQIGKDFEFGVFTSFGPTEIDFYGQFVGTAQKPLLFVSLRRLYRQALASYAGSSH